MPTETLTPSQNHESATLDRPLSTIISDPQETSSPSSSIEFSPWTRLCRSFLRCHQSPLNVMIHLLTTPLGLYGIYALSLCCSPYVLAAVFALQTFVVARYTPPGVLIAHTVVVSFLAVATIYFSPGFLVGCVSLATGFLGQDFAHRLTSEPTFQSSYHGAKNWWRCFAEHSLLLLPVLLLIASRWRQSPFRLLVARKAVLKTKLDSGAHRRDFGTILAWVRRKQPTVMHSTHWWQTDLDGEAHEAFDRLSRDPKFGSLIRSFHGPGYQVDPVLEMNEIYVTGPTKKTSSDTVFYMGHVDGPWSVYPGARLYRCMLALNRNLEVTTHFPMSLTQYSQPESHRLENGDAVAFDFNRELHFITRDLDDAQIEPRVNLKLHFVAYPRAVKWYGSLLRRLSTAYDTRARELFVATIKPNGLWQRIKTRWVLGSTRIFEWGTRYLGWTNVAYVALASILSIAMGSYELFLAATSFVHYAIYVGTLQERTPVSFGIFQRDAMFFKSLSMSQLFILYGLSLNSWPWSLGLVLTGFSLAGYATWVLGMERTLFAAELGFSTAARVDRFPFGFVPHPMILGAMAGICAMGCVPEFRVRYGWLIAGHLVCYSMVLGQEIFRSRDRLAA